ncbi:MAG: CRTAC1 family protein [Verrucomicrobia bacterium]|nr:CRTAC1 family protein [Verrucomicrobiota bacterium]
MARPRQRNRLLILAGALCAALAAGLLLRERRDPSQDEVLPGSDGRSVGELADELTRLEAREQEMDQTLWAMERLAEHCGLVFDRLWDSINAATNRLGTVRAFPFDELIIAKYPPARPLGHRISAWEPMADRSLWRPEQWRRFLDQQQRDGWQLTQAEFRQNRFETTTNGLPGQSAFYFSAHLINATRTARAALEGDLLVDWAPARQRAELPGVSRIDATRLKIKIRHGEPGFRPILAEELLPPKGSYFIDPLILYDLDGDGRSEIILAAKNLVFRQREGGRLGSEALCRHSPGLIFTGLMADFDGDGAADFLCAKFEGLALFRGSASGAFEEAGQLVWQINPHLKYGQAMTCGDIDGDGDLDVWLGQYKAPFERGQMPRPYFDANDGHPSYLLLNDGKGHFTDGTAQSGLEQKRRRRAYSASFADLDRDGDLDLLVVSDFAGLDLYANDGQGRFRDVTREWVGESRGFGMAHLFSDFNTDGQLDFLMIGMNSPTADRLEALGLHRAADWDAAGARRAMTYGNRLFLGDARRGGFAQTSLNDSIARTGWSWGAGAADFDNDGFPDVYIANGHESKQSVREYEPEFWLHDIYAANSNEGVVPTAFFGAKFPRTRGRGHSYGGYEKNRLLWNQHGESFVEIGHLIGVALEADSRNVVADDLDGDGRVDLLVTTFEVWPRRQQTLKVFRNELEAEGNWIGFRLREQGRGVSPVGAKITIRHANGAAAQQIVTGDSYRAQRPNTVHFGLGQIPQVDRVEIRWQNGESREIRQPPLNTYLDLTPD